MAVATIDYKTCVDCPFGCGLCTDGSTCTACYNPYSLNANDECDCGTDPELVLLMNGNCYNTTSD